MRTIKVGGLVESQHAGNDNNTCSNGFTFWPGKSGLQMRITDVLTKGNKINVGKLLASVHGKRYCCKLAKPCRGVNLSFHVDGRCNAEV